MALVANELRRVDPTRRPGFFRRLYSALGATTFARFVSRHVNWKLDPLVLRLTGGRFASTLMIPSALLETTGARTGKPRRNTVIYFHDPAHPTRVVVTPSNAGAEHHPSWFHNLVAHPDVTFGGIPMRAEVVDDEAERARLWPLADNVFPAYARYRQDAAEVGRIIPLVTLTPR